MLEGLEGNLEMKNGDRLRRAGGPLPGLVLLKALVSINTVFPTCDCNIHRKKREPRNM